MSTMIRSKLNWLETFPMPLPLLLFFTVTVLSCFAFVLTKTMLLLFLPGIFLFACYVWQDVRRVYLLLFATVPMSYEVYFSFGLGTDLPSEQFMWLLTLVGVALFLLQWRRIPSYYFTHPISFFLLAAMAWVLVTTLFSQNVIQSAKYFLAKSWYLVALYFLSLYYLKSKKETNQLFRYALGGVLFTVAVVFIRHAAEGLTYDSVNHVVFPFYRNHVSYACMIAVCLPYIYWFATSRSQKWQRQAGMVIFVFMAGVLYFTYTRAAIIAAIIWIVFRWIVIWKLIKPAFFLALFTLSLVFGHLVHKYNYLNYAPNYATTIQHQNFDDVLSATYRLEDLSTMERFYRWVAGYNMIKSKPVFGFGPANFYSYYKSYTVNAFTTYVSDNKDQSGVHNYYIMLLVEQGVIGLLLFLGLVYVCFVRGQELFHRLQDEFEKSLILAALGSVFIILTISFMNDMIETDKVGAIFFLSLALIVRGSQIKKKQTKLSPQSEQN